MAMIWFMLLACASSELERFHESLAEYDQGQRALQAGDWDAAEAAFVAAMQHHPESPELVGWRIQARVNSGDIEGALRLLDAAVSGFPDNYDFRYNRAALRARTGDLDGAESDLNQLFRVGILSPEETGEDPDFAALVANPEMAHLVRKPVVEVDLIGDEGAVLLGESVAVTLRVLSRRGRALTLTEKGEESRALHLERIVEDVLREDELYVQRELVFEYRAISEGAAPLGPWLISAGDGRGETEVRNYTVVALPGADGHSQGTSVAAFFPSSLLRDHDFPWAARVSSDWVGVAHSPDAVANLSPTSSLPQSESVRFEYRERGQTLWRGALHQATVPTRVSFQRDGLGVVVVEVP